MKKLHLIVIFCVITAVLSGCGEINVEINTSGRGGNYVWEGKTSSHEKPGNNDGKKDTAGADTGKSSDENVDNPENIINPLEKYDVLYPGQKGRDDFETCNLIKKFIDGTGAKEEEILMVNVNDYENTGEYSAFIFAGIREQDDYEEWYEGSMYFVSDAECTELEPGKFSWRAVDGCINYEERSYALAIDYRSATELITYMWEVRDGKPQETSISCLGDIRQDENGDITVTVSMYDAAYDAEMDTYMGHTYKPYYFYYDNKSDCIVEYGGKVLNIAQIDIVAKYDIVGDIEDLGYTVSGGYLRQNGILNINYYAASEYGVSYNNCNMNVDTGEFLTGYGYDATLEGSNYDGTYFATSGADCPATYPDRLINLLD